MRVPWAWSSRSGAAALALLLSAGAAGAGGPYTLDKDIDVVRGWTISANRVRNACGISTEFDDGMLIAAGIDASGKQKKAYMLFAHNSWSFVKVGQHYDITMVFNGGKRWTGDAYGVQINKIFGIAIEDVKTEFIVDFAQKSTVALTIGKRDFGRYNLSGTLAGLNAAIDCSNDVASGKIALGEAPAAPAPAPAPEAPKAAAAPSTGSGGKDSKREEVTEMSGTGFFVNDTGHMMTNAHVVDGCAKVTVRLPDGRVGDGTVQARSKQNDLAVIKTELKPTRFAHFRGTPQVRLGDSIVLFGYPLAGALTVTGNLSTGLISAMAGVGEDVTKMQISAPVQSGNSGGAVVDQTGHVVGVVVSKTNVLADKESVEVLQNVNFAIKAGVAGFFLDAQQIAYTVEAPGEALATPDVAALAKDFSGMIVCRPGR
jgi:S1-C subfamily serine protease